MRPSTDRGGVRWRSSSRSGLHATSRRRRTLDQLRRAGQGEPLLLIRRAFVEEQPVGNLTRDEILDNITLYWLTNTGVSASRLYWEYNGGFFNAKGVSIAVAVTVFPGEQYQAPRSWAERAYPHLIYFNEVDMGGHFAAWEQPELFSGEIRAAFRSLR
jgi:hypothetical protein